MDRSFKPLVSEQDFQEFAKTYVNAYPGIGTPADQMAQRLYEVATGDEASTFTGVYEASTLVGGMRLIDFKMNYHGTMITAGGVGGVAVDLLHKKKGIAKDLISYYLDYYAQKGSALAFLYPFRPDFYYKMGFGYGTKMNQYSFLPSSLPKGKFSGELVYLGAQDTPLIQDFYERLTRHKHGYCYKSRWEYEGLIKHSAAQRMMVGYKQNGQLHGYVAFGFRKAHENNFVMNNMVIREWLWETPEALSGLCHFLHTQADQVNRIIFNTQDPDFQWLLNDVRNHTNNIIPSVYHESNTAGIGVMYRIISLHKFIETNAERNFNGISLNLCLHLEDTLRSENHGNHHLAFDRGHVRYSNVTLDNAVKLEISLADLSALFLGSVDIRTLYRLGRISLEHDKVELLQELYKVPVKPECISAF